MTNLTPTPKSDTQPADKQDALPSPLRCLSGASISGGIAIALYFLTSSIAQAFASKPIASTNPTAVNLSVAVRTLVVGISTMATFVFGFIAVGLVFVTIYSSIELLKKKSG
jgi:hypothetical protein